MLRIVAWASGSDFAPDWHCVQLKESTFRRLMSVHLGCLINLKYIFKKKGYYQSAELPLASGAILLAFIWCALALQSEIHTILINLLGLGARHCTALCCSRPKDSRASSQLSWSNILYYGYWLVEPFMGSSPPSLLITALSLGP